MSTLTKVFVVLQLVLALVTSVMVILLVSAQPKYKDQVQAASAQAISSQLAVVVLQQQNANLSNANSELAKNLEKTVGDWKRQVDTLTQSVATSTKEKAELQVTLTNLETSIRGLTATNESLKNQNITLNDELKKARPDILAAIQKYAEVARKNDELNQQLNSATRSIRRLQEEMAAREEAANNKTSAAPAAAGSQVNNLVTGIQTATPVNAQVTRVESQAGRTFITMALGKRDGVRQGTQFVIYRGNQYVGDAVVRDVGVADCVAVVTVTKAGAAVQAGDMVISGANP